MGHFVETPSSLFRSVRYNTKTSPEVREAMQRKVTSLRSSRDEREQRIVKLREEYFIDAEHLARLVLQFQKNDSAIVSYNAQRREGGETLIPAGVIAHIVREREMIESEQEQIGKMELVLRNLRDTEPYIDPRTGESRTRPCLHSLPDDELKFLGF